MLGLGIHRKINAILAMFGLELRHLPKKLDLFNECKIDLLLDVGANKGQFVKRVRANYTGKIISFEPLSREHNFLLGISAHDNHWSIYNRVALGDRDDTKTIFISGNSPSSSLNEMSQLHIDGRPSSSSVGSESVDVERLDSILTEIIDEYESIYIKIDVQGYEKEVLDGLGSFIDDNRIQVISLEMSNRTLYHGQVLNPYFHEYMYKHGFHIVDITPAFINSQGELLQYDAVFRRSYE